MKKIQKSHLFLALAIALLAILCGVKLWEYVAHQKKYEEMPSTVAVETTVETTVPETEPETEVDSAYYRKIDFKSLKEKNKDVVAWIYIPDTKPEINYPILWKENDNEYYLRRDIDRRQGSYDGVFMDGDDSADLSEQQILFYGHHMKNRTMFTQICDFKEEEYFKEHRILYLYTPDHTYMLKTMACLYTDSAAEKRKVKFADQMEFDAYVNEMTKRCSFREIPEGGIEQMFALVTCSYEFNDARTILYCYEVDAEGNPVRKKNAEDGTETEENNKKTEEIKETEETKETK